MTERYKGTRRGFQYTIQSQYGLSLSEYDTLVLSQLGYCAICKRPTETMVVDHDHGLCKGQPGFIRGLLCNPCNAFMGKVDRDESLLDRLAVWRTQTSGVGTPSNQWRVDKWVRKQGKLG